MFQPTYYSSNCLNFDEFVTQLLQYFCCIKAVACLNPIITNPESTPGPIRVITVDQGFTKIRLRSIHVLHIPCLQCTDWINFCYINYGTKTFESRTTTFAHLKQIYRIKTSYYNLARKKCIKLLDKCKNI